MYRERIVTKIDGLAPEEYPVTETPHFDSFAEVTEYLESELTDIWDGQFTEIQIVKALCAGIKLGQRILAKKTVNNEDVKAARKLKTLNQKVKETVSNVNNMIDMANLTPLQATGIALKDIKDSKIHNLVLTHFEVEVK